MSLKIKRNLPLILLMLNIFAVLIFIIGNIPIIAY